jgi:hypothetical protein
MRKLGIAFVAVAILGTGIIAAPTLYAQGGQAPSGPTGGQGMMRDGMMGPGGMSGMMGMMQQMTQMMDQCNAMMTGRSGDRPNDQWRKDAPATPEKKG